MNFPQSLCGVSVRPVCDNHKPEVDLVEGAIEVSCPSCCFFMTMSIDTYLELMKDDVVQKGITNASLDILKFSMRRQNEPS